MAVVADIVQTPVIAPLAAATLPDTLVMQVGAAHRGRKVGVKPARLPDGGLRV